MDILLYLSELVQTRKAIGISGLGTIYKKKLPGRYDIEIHSFVPPSYVLGFTEEVKEDVLLPEFISRKRNISAETAIYFINEFSENLQQQLTNHNEADLGILGKLKKTDGKLFFEPAHGFDLGFDFYGLPSIKAEPPFTEDLSVAPQETSLVKTEESVEQQTADLAHLSALESLAQEQPSENIPPAAAADTTQEVSSLAAVAADNQLTEENPGDAPTASLLDPEITKETELLNEKIETLNTYRAKITTNPLSATEQEEVIWNLKEPPHTSIKPVNQYHTLPDVLPDPEVEKTMPVIVKVFIIIAVLLAALTAAYLIKPDLFNGLTGTTPQQTQTYIAPVVKDTATVSTDSASITGNTVSGTVPPTGEDTTVVKNTATPISTTDSVITYEIIGASVLNQKEANYFIYQMKKSGIQVKALPKEPGKKRLKMSLATFNDRASAETELKKMAGKLKIEGIYIYRYKQH